MKKELYRRQGGKGKKKKGEQVGGKKGENPSCVLLESRCVAWRSRERPPAGKKVGRKKKKKKEKKKGGKGEKKRTW